MLNKNEIRILRTDLATHVAALRPLKASLRRRWPGPMADVQAAALALAREITDRQILLAWTRGRRHLSSAPRWLRDLGRESELEDVQRRIAERVASDYRESSPAPREAASG
jgi:hypothetical protein